MTYRGVQVGRVGKLVLTDDGVDVYLDIDNAYDEIPADTLAVVGNRSAVGEQYVELQPQHRRRRRTSRTSSEIAKADTRTPIATDKLLTDLSETVESVDKQALATTVDELGAAFAGTGEDLQRIIDTGNSFINDRQRQLRHHHRADPRQQHGAEDQVDKAGAIRNFAQQLSLVQRLAGRRRPRPAPADRHRARRPPPSCAPSWSRTASTSAT